MEKLPLFFIHEGIYYTKEFDGFYYSWKSLTDYFNKKNFLNKLQIREVRILLEESRFKQTICYYTNSADKRL
jgi:hypothetical protein